MLLVLRTQGGFQRGDVRKELGTHVGLGDIRRGEARGGENLVALDANHRRPGKRSCPREMRRRRSRLRCPAEMCAPAGRGSSTWTPLERSHFTHNAGNPLQALRIRMRDQIMLLISYSHFENIPLCASVGSPLETHV